MREVFIDHTSSLKEPKYVKTQSIAYQSGIDFGVWEMVHTHNTVHILVENTDTREILFVKQVRIPVLVNDPDTKGEVIECCAGIIDGYEGSPPLTRAMLIARDEIKEELGYDIPYETIKLIKELKSSVGLTGSTSYTFKAKVQEKDYIGQQLKLLEDIEVVKIPYNNVKDFINAQTTDATTIFLTHRWLLNGN